MTKRHKMKNNTEVLKSFMERTANIAGTYLNKDEYLKCIQVINNLDESLYTEDLKTEFGNLNLLKAESYLNLSENENDEQKDNVLNSINCFRDVVGIFPQDENPQKAAEINLNLGSLFDKLI